MGADLYLRSVMDAAQRIYQPTFDLAFQTYRLMRGDAALRLGVLSDRLFEEVRTWGAREGLSDTAIFDLSSQVRDLAQGEHAAWLQELVGQLLREVQGDADLLPLAKMVADLVQGRTEMEVYALVDLLVEGLERESEDPQAGALPRLVEALEAARRAYDLARGDPAASLRDVTAQLCEQLRSARAELEAAQASLGELVGQMQQWAAEQGEGGQEIAVRVGDLQRAFVAWNARMTACFDDQGALAQRLLDLVAERGPSEATPQEDAPEWLAAVGSQGAELLQALAEWQQSVSEGAEAMLAPLNGRFALFPVEEDEQGAAPGDGGDGQPPEVGTASPEAEVAPTRPAFPDLLSRFVAGVNAWSMTAMPAMLSLVQGIGSLRDLANGQTADLFRSTTRELVEYVRPELSADPQAGESTPPPEIGPDADILDRLWYEVYYGGGKVAGIEAKKRRKEAEADSSDFPLFRLALQLRDLAHGDATRLLGNITAHLLEVARQKRGDGSGDPAAPGGVSDALVSLAEQVADLSRGEPMSRLRALSAELVERLRHIADPEAGPLPLALQVAELAQGQTRGQLHQLLQNLALQVAELEEDPGGRVAQVRAALVQARDLLCAEDAGARVRALIEARLDALTQSAEGGESEGAADDPEGALAALIARVRAHFEGGERGELAERERLGEVIPLLLDALPLLIRTRGGLGRLREALLGGGSSPLEQAREDEPEQDEPPPRDRERLIEEVLAGIAQALLYRALGVLDGLLYPAEGYYRDGYNDSCVLWTTGLFWMTDIDPITQELGDEDWPDWWRHRQPPKALTVPQIRQLYQHIQQADLRMPSRERLARWPHLRVEDEGEHSLASWHAHLREGRERLLAFLDGALRREEILLCSL